MVAVGEHIVELWVRTDVDAAHLGTRIAISAAGGALAGYVLAVVAHYSPPESAEGADATTGRLETSPRLALALQEHGRSTRCQPVAPRTGRSDGPRTRPRTGADRARRRC